MDKKTQAVFELVPSPMLGLKDGRIIYANSLARELFGRELVDSSPIGIIPEHILASASPSFVSSATVNDKPYTVRHRHIDGLRFITLEQERSRGASSEFLSDSLMSSMLSTLFTLGMAIDRIMFHTESIGDKKLDEYLAMLNHNYYSLRHALLNLSTIISLKKACLPYYFYGVDLCRLCSDTVSTVAHLCSHRGVSINFSTQHGELFAYADGEKIERVILNLLSNSLAHTAPGDRITLGLEKSGDTAYISVDDTGCGISASTMADIFSAWERETDLRTMAEGGGGLGLAVARGLIEGHDGALLIESREGKGTSVRVMLPLKTASLGILESPGSNYVNRGISLFLTELSAVLDKESYSNKYQD